MIYRVTKTQKFQLESAGCKVVIFPMVSSLDGTGGGITSKTRPLSSRASFVRCAQHGRTLVGESPIVS